MPNIPGIYPTKSSAIVKTLTESTKLAIGPANYSGQAYAWARAAEQYLGIKAVSFGLRSKFNFPVDIEDPTECGQLIYNRDYTHLIVDGFLPFLGKGNIAADVAKYSVDRPTPLGLLAHGSEFRSPRLHMRRIRHSHFKSASPHYLRNFNHYTRMTHQVIKDSGMPLFVSTPDLLLEGFPGTWVPVVVNGWHCNKSLSDRKPKVLHHPSRTDPPLKGTTFIMPVLEAMDDAGKIELIRSEMGEHKDVKPLVQECDILVEQILIGSYGVAAVEGLQAGKIVVGYVADDVRALVDEPIPIIDAPPDRFSEIMHQVVDNWDHYRTQTGIEYADKLHTGRASAEALRGFLS